MPADNRKQPLTLSIVGHTNTGKTSLLRTLTRDGRFGDVSSRPSTTRHVESIRLMLGSQPVIELFDTPGMEDSIALLEFLEQLKPADGARLDGPDRIRLFLQQPEATNRFEQEAKVLRQLLLSDAALYVIDARDPVLAKHRDELAILSYCAVPLLPLLNFVSSPQAEEKPWRDALARLGLHALVRFDTVAPARDGERELYGKLGTLLDQHQPTLDKVIASHEEDARQRRQAALAQLAELLLDVAACQVKTPVTSESELQASVEKLNRIVRQREQSCTETLLALYNFSGQDVEEAGLPLINGDWQEDLFDPETLSNLGISVSGGAAAGAAAGLGIDLMLGGLTLGSAAAIGALAGGGLQTIRHYGDRIRSSFSGEQVLRVDDSILRLLATRQLLLITTLENRGHAATGKLYHTQQHGTELWPSGLPSSLHQARRKPSWYGKDADSDSNRYRAMEALVRALQEQFPST